MKSYLNDDERQKYEGTPPEGAPEQENEPEMPSPKSDLDFEVPEKVSVFEQFRISIVSPKQLIGLSTMKVSRFVRYTLFMGFLMTLMLYIIPVSVTLIHIGGLRDLFENRTPDFKLTNGVLEAKERFTIELGSCDIIVDTSGAIVPEDSYEAHKLTFAIGSRKLQAVISNNGMNYVLVEGAIKDYLPEGFDRQMLISAVPGFYIALVLAGIILMVITLGKYLLASLLYMLIAWGIARNTGLDLNKGNVFRLCFYAQTIGMLLVNINKATGGYLPSLIVSMVGIFITLIYVFKPFRPYARYSTDE